MVIAWRPPTVEPGYHVYVAWGRGRRVLYVGQSGSVMYRVGQHYDKSPWARDVIRWEFHPCASWVEMATLEARLIAEHQPPHNKQRPSPPWATPELVE